MRGGRQDAEVEVFLNVKLLVEFLCEDTPLVITEIIEHHEVYFLALAEQGEYLAFEHLGR